MLRERDRAGAISLRGFYWRRALRILPLYYLVVTLAGIYFVIGRGHLEVLQIWPAYYLFFANFLTEHIPTLYPTWSLSMEEQFYLIWPLVMIWLPPRYWGAVVLFGVALNVVAVTGMLGALGITAFQLGPLWVHLPDATYAPLLLGAGLALMLHQPRGFALLWRVFGHRWMPFGLFGIVLALIFGLLPQILAGVPYLLVHLAMTGWLATLVLREAGAGGRGELRDLSVASSGAACGAPAGGTDRTGAGQCGLSSPLLGRYLPVGGAELSPL